MALGEYSIFTWKSRATQDREQEEYEKWAFPYGAAQREKLQALLRSLYPKESIQATLIAFLTCKELYESALRKSSSSEDATDLLINKQKSYKRIIKKRDMAVYISLVLADAAIDAQCEYPGIETIREHAQRIESIRNR